jgi:DNA helicase-2/ATP-dependent DNA helicase PcrA
VFIDEISTAEARIKQQLPADKVESQLAWAMQPVQEVYVRMANAQAIDRVLQQFTMSYTALSKYLKCQLAFYFEMVLRVPFQKNDALAFGSAVHFALERLFIDMKAQKGNFPSKDQMLELFKKAMYSESSCFTNVQFERRMEQGQALLTEYYDHYIPTAHKDVEIEYKIPRYNLDGVPVTAKIDKLEMDGENCTVIDYKTGDPDKSGIANTAPPNEKNPDGGDYWRQMVFYKLLIENYSERNWKVTMGKFDYVQKNKFGEYKQITVPVFKQDEDLVRNQLKDAYARIMNHEFSHGCGKPECHWCNFAKKYQLVRPVEDELVEIDDL